MSRLLLLALAALVLAPLAEAQNPYDCYPDIDALVFGPSPFPDPYPDDALTAPAPSGRSADWPSLADRLRSERGARANSPERPSATRGGEGGGTFCATDYRSQSWDGVGSWSDNFRNTATYDAAGRLLSLSTYYDTDGSGLELRYRDSFTYDGAGRVTDYLFEETFGGSTLQPSSRLTFTYDGAGRMTDYLGEEATSSGWAPESRITFGYGGGPYATSLLSEYWNGTAWENSDRATYTYTADNQPATYLGQEWDGNSWENYDREQYTYDGAGRLTFYTDEEPVGPTGWELNGRDVFAYDGAGRVSESRYQQWTGSTWQDSGVVAFAYDGNSLLSEVIYSNNQSGTGTLVPSSRDRFLYAGGLVAESVSDSWDGSAWQFSSRSLYTRDGNGRTTEGLSQNWTGSGWVNSYRSLYGYDGSIATEGGPAAEALALAVGPNPVAGAATVRFTLAAPSAVRLSVTDVLGREVAVVAEDERPAGAHAVAFDARRLAPGLYVARLAAGGTVATHTLTVAR